MSFLNALNFKDKQVLVCGASDGIGYGIAKAFLDCGADVAITGTRAADDYQNDFSYMTFYSLNIQDSAAITKLAK